MDFEYDHAAESGQIRADRSRAKAASLRAEADRLEAFASAVDKGNEGERLTARQLDVLDGAGWSVLNDRRKTAQSLANIDHIVVGPPGVFVIDSKHWNTRVRLDDRGLFAAGYAKDREITAVRQAAMAVQMHLSGQVPGLTVAPVLCFTRPVGLAGVASGAGVSALELPGLLPWLTGLPERLSPQDVRRVSSSLDAAFSPRLSPSRATTPRSASPQQRTSARKSGTSKKSRTSDGDKLRLVLAAIVALLLITGTYGAVASWFTDGLTKQLVPHPSPTVSAPARTGP